MQKKQSNGSSGINLDALVNLMGGLMSKVGTIGFIVILGCFFLIKFTDTAQKKEIIDTWFLFKNQMSINILIGFIFLLFVTLIFHNYHYKSKVKILKERINEISEEKKFLQEELLKKKLKSSK